MKLTVITATYQRPDAFKLCELYMSRQTRQPDQWLVLDGKDRMQKKVLDCIESGVITGDAICFVEDDDHYREDYLSWAYTQILRGYELVGEGNMAYYNVASRWWSECLNVRHAALCATSLHKDLLGSVVNIIKSYDWPFFDTRIWPLECNKKLFLPRSPKERRVIGIKGIRSLSQKPGYSGEHHDIHPQGTTRDPSLLQLFKWIGSDAAAYSKFRTI